MFDFVLKKCTRRQSSTESLKSLETVFHGEHYETCEELLHCTRNPIGRFYYYHRNYLNNCDDNICVIESNHVFLVFKQSPLFKLFLPNPHTRGNAIIIIV